MKKSKKLLSLRALVRRLEKERRRKKVVFTNGCFDILHVGHTRALRQARALGDILVVGLNTDLSVRKIKGQGRPVVHETERAEMLAALAPVDYVVFFPDPTPERVIRALRPDVICKGGDWTRKNMVGAAFVESYGGKAVPLGYVKGFSTTRLLEKIKRLG